VPDLPEFDPAAALSWCDGASAESGGLDRGGSDGETGGEASVPEDHPLYDVWG